MLGVHLGARFGNQFRLVMPCTTVTVTRFTGNLKFNRHCDLVLQLEGSSLLNSTGRRLLEVKTVTVTFSSDSSRKWPVLWFKLVPVGENLDRSWQGALFC